MLPVETQLINQWVTNLVSGGGMPSMIIGGYILYKKYVEPRKAVKKANGTKVSPPTDDHIELLLLKSENAIRKETDDKIDKITAKMDCNKKEIIEKIDGWIVIGGEEHGKIHSRLDKIKDCK